MSKVISLDLSKVRWVHCKACETSVPPDEYNGDTDECQECHDNAGYALDECGCTRCFDNAVSQADFND